jgi:uncharacterized membrane protein
MKVIIIVSDVIGLVGMGVLAWGAVLALFRLVALEARRVFGENICERRQILRHHFGSYILLGLEFLIAADIIRTLIEPSLEELAVLGTIVAIRTVISFFLNWEMREGHNCDRPRV